MGALATESWGRSAGPRLGSHPSPPEAATKVGGRWWWACSRPFAALRCSLILAQNELYAWYCQPHRAQ